MTPNFSKILVLGLLSISPISAQQPEEEEKAPLRTFTVIPVGRISDTVWIGEGERTKAVAVDPGATPPPQLFYKNPKGKFEALTLLLNGNSTPAILNRPKLEIYQKAPSGEDDKPKPFIEADIPIQAGHYDVILWRRANKADWEDSRRLVMPSSYPRFPKNSIRLLNINAKPIRVQLGSEVHDIPASSARILKIPSEDVGKNIRTRIAYADDKSWKFVLRSAIKIKDGQRVNVIIYPSRIKERLCEVARFFQAEPAVIKAKDGE